MPEDTSKISKETNIQLGFAVTVLTSLAGVLVGGAVFVMNDREWKLNMLRDIKEIRTTMDNNTADRYTLSMASEDAMRESIMNPGHRVPDPRNPGKVIVVEGGGKIGAMP